jgi:sugar lactone lactonase YvrE
MASVVRVAVDARAAVGESPVWDERSGSLYWVDIPHGEVHRIAEGVDTLVARYDKPVGAIAKQHGGGFIAAIGLSFAAVGPDLSLRWIADVSLGDRMNDGKCDAAGRFLAGTLCNDRSPNGGLYRLNTDGTVETLLTGVAVSNGLDWSPAGDILYYVDSPTRRIDMLAYDPETGDLGTRRTFAEMGDIPGNPDGLTVDAEGGVWVVMHRGGRVCRFTPQGHLDEVIHLPVGYPTSCAFGGESYRTLYITSARASAATADGMEPLAGAIFETNPGVAGKAAFSFGGRLGQ